MRPLNRRVFGELCHVEFEIVVGNLPWRIKNKRGSGDTPFPELSHRITDLTAAPPDIGRNPRTECPRWWQWWSPCVPCVVNQNVGELGTVHNVETKARKKIGNYVALR